MMMNRIGHRWFGIGLLAVLLLVVNSALAQDTQTVEAKPKSILEAVDAEIDSIAGELEKDKDYEKALQSSTRLFDRVMVYASDREQDAFHKADFNLRKMMLLHGAHKAEMQTKTRAILEENPDFAAALLFNMDPQGDRPFNVAKAVVNLHSHHGKALNSYANLAAAICLVHDVPLSRHINENRVAAEPAEKIFEFYMKNENRMLYGVKDVPVSMLVYVVDNNASLQEMAWALKNFQGDRNVGKRFFDIKYDYDHYRFGAQKKVTQEGFNLMNIAKFGGVCADQAYFAMTVGKSIGVPTTYTVAQSGEVGHAWVGFFQTQGRQAHWNFDSGRYPEYQGIRGNVMDPQVRRNLPDSVIGLQAEMRSTTPKGRQISVAFSDAASRLMKHQADEKAMEAEPFDLANGRGKEALRSPTTKDILALIGQSLDQNPANRDAWLLLRELAERGQMEMKDIRIWAGEVEKLAGQKYPDFAAYILIAMIRTVEDVKEQNILWNRAFSFFSRRADLAAAIRMEQAEMWEKAGNQSNAGQCYEDVIKRFANAGPFVLTALQKSEKLLIDMGREQMIPALYQQTWQRIKQPPQSAFNDQSNWYQVGVKLAKALEAAGRENEAAKVRQQIGVDK